MSGGRCWIGGDGGGGVRARVVLGALRRIDLLQSYLAAAKNSQPRIDLRLLHLGFAAADVLAGGGSLYHIWSPVAGDFLFIYF